MPAAARALATDRRAGTAIGAATPLIAGHLSSLIMPHGPATAGQALVVIATSLLVGVAAGWGLRSRWAMLAAPLLYAVAYAVGALAVAVALPPSTPPIVDADGRPVDGAVTELATVRLGGADQRILVRAQDPDKPVLLWLAGGPGQTDLAIFRAIMDDLTRDFVVVTWDQRGTGASYAAIDPAADMTLDRLVGDTIELADHLRARFDEERIYLTGLSWGSTLGVLAVLDAPDRFHAFIGNGQMVSHRETDRRIYDDLLAYADRTGNPGLRARMEVLGRPPCSDLPCANASVLDGAAHAPALEQYEAFHRFLVETVVPETYSRKR